MNALDANAQNFVDTDFVEYDDQDQGELVVQNETVVDAIVETVVDSEEYAEKSVGFAFNLEDFSFLNTVELPKKNYYPILVKDLPAGHPYIQLASALGFSKDSQIALAKLAQSVVFGDTYSTASGIYPIQIQRRSSDGVLILGDVPLEDIFKIPDVMVSPHFGMNRDVKISSGTISIPTLRVCLVVPVRFEAHKTIINMAATFDVKINPESDDLVKGMQDSIIAFNRKKIPANVEFIEYELEFPRTLSDIKHGVYYIKDVVVSDAVSKEGSKFKAVNCKYYCEESQSFADLSLAGGAASMIRNSQTLVDTSHDQGLLLDFGGFNARGAISHVLCVPTQLYPKYKGIMPDKYTQTETSDLSNMFADSPLN